MKKILILLIVITFAFSSFAQNITQTSIFTAPAYLIGSITHTINKQNSGGNEVNTVNNNIQTMETKTVAFMPLIEGFTGSTCSPCATFNKIFNPLYAAKESNINLIKYQQNIPQMDAYTTIEGNERRLYYGGGGIPNYFVNGKNISSNPNLVIATALYDGQNLTSFFEITGSINTEGKNLKSNVAIMPYKDFSNLTVHAVICEKITTGNVGSNGETEFHNVMMKMYPDQNGKKVSFTTNTIFNLNFTQDMTSTHVEEMNDLILVVFIQDATTKEIFQSKKFEVLTSGIGENDNIEARIYPNPASQTINVEVEGVETIRILDILGKEMIMINSKNSIKQEINVSELKNGTYFVNIKTAKGIFTKKLIIK